MVTITDLGRRLGTSHERVVAVHDADSGLRAFIALHSTNRGPAFGGCRMKPYASPRAALRDALRLSEAMSRKAAMAYLPFGGGKCVVMGDPATQKTEPLLLALADALNALGGSYHTADDVGTTVQDMEVMRRVTPYARGLPLTDGTACPAAAYGTFTAVQAAVELVHGHTSLHGVHVAVQGLGNLGMQLCAYLHGAGARLTVADLSADRVALARSRFGAQAVPADAILSVPADVLSPNALGDVLCDRTIPAIQAPLIVGGANNQLRSPRHGLALHRRGIVYVPDYIANAGGLIDVAMEGPAYDPRQVLGACDRIRRTTYRLLSDARRLGLAPSELADRLSASAIRTKPPARRMMETAA